MSLHPLAASGVLRVAINLGNPVLAQGEAAAPRGASVWLAERLADALGLPMTLQAYPSAGAVVDDVGQDAWDMAFLAIDPLRAEQILFSAPYVEIEGTWCGKTARPVAWPILIGPDNASPWVTARPTTCSCAASCCTRRCSARQRHRRGA